MIRYAHTNLVARDWRRLASFYCARALRPGGRALLVELHPYRQLVGKQARFVDPEDGRLRRVVAHAHSISELTDAASAAGLRVLRVGEHGDGGARAAPGSLPRLLALELRR